MSALSNQYKGFRLLLEENGTRTMFIDHVQLHESTNSATLYLDNIRPYEATEAYMFAPLGYWKTIYQDPLYPDDYPYDLMPGINSSTDTIEIKTDVINGTYEYFYYYLNNWRKLIIKIQDKKIIKINSSDTSNFKDETYYNIKTISKMAISMDVQSRFTNDIPTTITVKQTEANQLPTSIVIKRYANSSLNSDFIVTHVSDIPTTLFINGRSILPTNIIIKINCENNIPTNVIVAQHKHVEIPTNITIKYTLDYNIPTNLFVYQTSKLPTNITIKQFDSSKIPLRINIQRVDRSNLPTNITIKRWGEDVPYIRTNMIVVRHEQSYISTNIYVIGIKKDTLLTTLTINKNIINNVIPSYITIKNNLESKLPTSLIVTQQNPISLDTIFNLNNNRVYTSSDLYTTAIIKNKLYSDLLTQIYVNVIPIIQTTNNFISKQYNDLPTNLSIINHSNKYLTTSLIINRKTDLISTIDFNSKTHNDLPTYLTIKAKNNSYIDTYMIVNRIGLANTISNISSQHIIANNNMPTNLTVIHKEQLSIPSTIIVLQSHTKINAQVYDFTQLGKSQIPTSITVQHCLNNYLPTFINVNAHNIYLKTILDFTHGKTYDVPTELSVRYKAYSNLPITMRVNPIGQINTIINHFVYNNNDLPTYIFIPSTSSIKTYLVISDKLALESKAKTVPNNIIKKNVYAAKDSYVYNFTRLTNYGKYQFLNVGYTNKNDILKTIIGFDFSTLGITKNNSAQYFDYQTIQKATLYLYKTSSLAETTTINVYSIDDNWYENTINYNKEVVLNKQYLTSIQNTQKNGWITIDITKDLNNIESTSFNRSYLLEIENKGKTNTIVSFASMQNKNSQNVPYVNVAYYHTPNNADWNDLPTTINIKPYNDLPTTITIPERFKSNLPTSLEIKAIKKFDTNFTITINVATNINNNYLPTTLDVIGYRCDKIGIDVNLYINALQHKSYIETNIIVVRNPKNEAYMYIL